MKAVRTAVLFIILVLLGFFVGGTIVAFTIEQPSGLAGGATAAIWALVGAFIGLLFAIYVFRNASGAQIIKINLVSSIMVALLFGLIQIRKANAVELDRSHFPIGTYQNDDQVLRSLGIASPNFYEFPTLYFYNPNLEKAVDEHTPIDSLVFARTEQGFEISYAPPWYFPEYMKLDYGILLHKVITVGKDWVELEVNRSTQQTAWVDATRVSMSYWPEFLLNTNSIESIDPTANPVRTKALDHAAEVSTSYTLLRPVMVKGEWMKVDLLDDSYEKVADGWIRWTKNGSWVIKYSLLS